MPESASSATGQIALRALGPRSLRLLGALVVYGALLYVGFGLGAALPLERALLRTAAWTMDRVSGGTIERTVNLEPRGSKALYVVELREGAQLQSGSFGHPFHTQNLMLFWALVALTPGLSKGYGAAGFLAGSALIGGLDVLIAMGDLWVAENVGLETNTLHGPARGVSEISLWLRFMHPTGGAFMAPLFIWALLLFVSTRRTGNRFPNRSRSIAPR